MFNSSLEIIIKAKDEASEKIAGLNSKLKSMEPAFKSMAKVGTVAFGAISALAVTSFKAFADAQAQTVITNKSLENTLNQLNKGALATLKKQLGGVDDVFGAVKKSAELAGKAAIKMGFDDEAAANSFAKLFAITKDVTTAQKEQTLAMDLARYKNISLEEATQKLVLVHAGATKELKALGLAVVDGATATENLAAIQRQAGGAAEAYSKTQAGAMEIMKVNADNLRESIGGALEPAFTKLRETLVPLVQKFADWAEANPDLVSKIIIFGGVIAGLTLALGVTGLTAPAIITGIKALGGALEFLAANPVIILGAAIAVLFKAFYDLVQVTGSVQNAFIEIGENVIKWWKQSGEWIYDKIEKLIKLAERAASMGLLGSVAKLGMTVVNAVKGGGRAQGGNVSSGSSYLVGEHGPELFTPGTSGSITPNNKMGGGGASFVVNINGGQYLSQDAALDMGDKIIRALQTQMRGA